MKNKTYRKKLFFCAASLMLIAALNTFFMNIWLTLVESEYFIPSESSIFTFQATKMNSGSGEWWLFGEDNHNFYGLNIQTEQPLYWVQKKHLLPMGFDQFDYTTWTEYVEPDPNSKPSPKRFSY